MSEKKMSSNNYEKIGFESTKGNLIFVFHLKILF